MALAESDPRCLRPAGARPAKPADRTAEKPRHQPKSRPAKPSARPPSQAEDASQRRSRSPPSQAAEAKPPRKPDKQAEAGNGQAHGQAATNGSRRRGRRQARPGLRESYAAIPLAERMAMQIRPGLDRRLQRPDQRRVQRAAGRGRQGLPEAQAKDQGHRRAQPAGARGARRRGAAAAGRGRLAPGRGPGDRRAPRRAGQARDQARARPDRHALELGSRASCRSRPSASTPARRWRRVRAAEEATRRTARRPTTCCAPDFFVVSGMQGLKKFYVRGFAQNGEVRGLTILYDQAMDGTWIRSWSRCRARSCRSRLRGGRRARRAARARSNTRTGLVVSAAGHIVTDAHADRRLPGDRACRARQRRARRRATGRRACAAARLWRAQAHADRRCSARRARDATSRWSASPIRRRRAAARAVTAARPRSRPARPLPLEPAPALGFSGAAALDAQGRSPAWRC